MPVPEETRRSGVSLYLTVAVPPPVFSTKYLLQTLNGHSTPGAACSIPDIDISSPTVGPLWSFRLHVSNKSKIAQQALINIGQLCEVKREVKHVSTDERGRIRKDKSKPLVDALH